MFLRALCIALALCASGVWPLGTDDDCALFLSGPGRSSAYDYTINLLKGNPAYEGQHTCITYEAINQAYLEARNRIVVAQPKGDWKPEDFASVGELILDISMNLARKYSLSYEEIEKGLPLIDTSRTLIREVCPPVFSHVECRAGKYRRMDGLCNNLEHPTWGATNAPFQRLIGPLFADGINAPRISHTGRELPPARVVSRTMHPDDGFHDHAGTVMVIAWGQFMDHDYTLTGTPLDPVNRNDPEECCKRPLHLKHPYCNEIIVPDDDYFYRLFGVKCIDFVRAFPSPRPGCRLGSRVPYNTLTGAIDGNTVYGVTEKFARKLRTGYGGLLRMNPVFKEYGLRDLLPLKLDIPDEGCTRPNKNMYCFEAGEIRVNEQLVLTVMHTLMAREHNRVANALAEVNPHWDDETLFQEARRINIAEIQHITYNEFLPILLGKDVMEKFGLVLEKEGYWNGYDPEVNPDVIDSFAAAAYRFGHSLLPTAVERWSKAHKFIASKRLSDLIRRPYDLYRAGVLDEYVMGLMNQVAQAMDDSITQEVTNHLFKKIGAKFGMDLVSFNMQRGREFGLPGYMEFRKFCGLPGANSFQDLFGTMSNETVRKFESIFEHPIDVDLWSGGVSERPLPGSMLGPTFACIIATQFSYSRRGDRFWYELPNQPSTFTPEQMTEIKKSRLARVICDNTDIIDTVQLYPMVLPDHELNPRVPCRSGIMPSMDFTKWAEPAPFQGPAKKFMTEAQVADKNLASSAGDGAIVSVNDSDCTTANDFQLNQNSDLITLQILINHTATNEANKSTQVQNCSEKNTADEKDCPEQLSVSNEIPQTNTVLKYVYKKGEKPLMGDKTKPHPLNSLRKKRSLKSEKVKDNVTVSESKNIPLIVNYETNHPPRVLTENSIQNSALANFNIETTHERDLKKSNRENDDRSVPSSEASNENNNSLEDYTQDSNSSESSENDSPRKSTAKLRESISDDSNENVSGEVKSIESSNEGDSDTRNKQHSDESDENLYRDSSSRQKGEKRITKDRRDSSNINSNNRFTHNERNDKFNEKKPAYLLSRHTDESLDSREIIFPRSSEETKEIKENLSSLDENHSGNRDDEKNLKNKQSYKNKENFSNDKSGESTSIKKSGESTSIESSGETHSYDKDKTDSAEPKSKKAENLKQSKPIQDVDLRDFSFERIQVDDKGQVTPIEDDNNFNSTKEKVLSPITHQSRESSSRESESDEEAYLKEKDPIQINDGEVKPVKEINSENSETTEDSEESINLNSEDDVSLETLLGTKEKIVEEKVEKSAPQKEDVESKDVKQEFERIPLNYEHKISDPNESTHVNKNSDNSQNEEPNTLDENKSSAHDDGASYVSTPDVKYDDNLKFKFDDISIKLPDIKLPQDILSYTYEEPPYKKVASEIRNDEDNYHGYYEPYAPDNKKKTHKQKQNSEQEDENEDEDEDENEDLYEKFVRERFGKQGSFLQRSEKLQTDKTIPKDDKLYDSIKNIYKKTQHIQKQADESGDPNAAYMWTLEYGKKL